MDEKIILGIDLSDAGTVLAVYGEEGCTKVPTVICRIRNTGEWYVGEKAYEKVLDGTGIITDKLLSLTSRDGFATLDGNRFSGKELLTQFLKRVIEQAFERLNFDYPSDIVVSLPEVDKHTVQKVYDCLLKLGYRVGHVHVISRSESFIYYVMSQSSDIYSNHVGLFSMENACLTYYEMKVQRKGRNVTVYADREVLDESFNLDILSSQAGARLGDKILTSCAERLLRNKVFSAVILTGKGFETQEWAPSFMKFVCQRRKVFVDDEVFARGAGFRGYDFAAEKPVFSFICICDGRLESSVYIDISQEDRVVPYPIASIGDPWHDIERSIRLIPNGINTLELSVIPMEARQRRKVRIPLDFLPQRPNRTTMISLKVSFNDSRTMLVDIRDLGFGELYPATDAHLSREVRLWE